METIPNILLTFFYNRVPNAIAGRDNLDIEIFGMEGIPEQDMIEHEQRIQNNNQNNNKKAKSSGSGQYGELSLEQLQQQMAAHKAATSPTVATGPTALALPAPTSAVVAAPVAYPPPPAPAAVAYPPQPDQAQGYYGYGQPYGGYPPQPYGNQYYSPQPPNAYPPQGYGFNNG